MKKRLLIGIVLAWLLGLLAGGPAWAGGWAVVTLDQLPTEVHAEETITLGFIVRQHGVTPTNGVKPYLTTTNQATRVTVQVDARQDGAVGHFLVDMRFPSQGTWTWSVTPAPFESTEFGTLTVLPPLPGRNTGNTNIETAPQPTTSGLATLLRWGGLTTLLAAVALALVSRRRLASAR